MAVAWYGVKVWNITSPTGEVVWGTRPTRLYTWEMWTVTKDDGDTVQVPQRVRPKYQGLATSISVAYDHLYSAGPPEVVPTVALIRVEHPDGTDPPLEAADYISLLNTQAKWNAAMTQYPELKYRFADQPYYPAVG